MARRCDLTGKGVMVGKRVSRANNKNKRSLKIKLVLGDGRFFVNQIPFKG